MRANNYIFNLITSPIASPNLVDDDAGVHFGGCHSSCLMVVVVSIGTRDVVYSIIVGSANSYVPLLESDLSNEPFINIHVSLIFNEVLKAQLTGNIENNCLDQNDWLDDFVSSPYMGDGDDLDGPNDDIQATYNLHINHIVEKAFTMDAGKRRRRKPKRK